MKKQMMKKIKATLGFLILGGFCSQAEVVKISDLDGLITVINTPALGATDTIAARIGLWNGTTFTSVGNTVGAGYFDNDLRELSATISSASNPVGYTSGTLLALAIYNAPSTTDYSVSFNRAILTDSSWTMPTLAFGTGTKASYSLTANTVAQFGSYSFNGGNQTITLVPEPSTGALMVIGAIGLLAQRRFRRI